MKKVFAVAFRLVGNLKVEVYNAFKYLVAETENKFRQKAKIRYYFKKIIILPAYKGNATLILNTSSYNLKLE